VKLHGYDIGFREEDEPTPRSLGEITFPVSDASALRRIAAFFQFAADELDAMGNDFEHVHLRDWDNDWTEEETDVIVYRVP
jgi:hypothetical protein